MGKSSPPPPPDYSAIAAANQTAANNSFALGQAQLDWAKEQYASQSEMTQGVIDNMLEAQEFAMANAQRDRARYERIYQPIENQLVKDSKLYQSGKYQDEKAADAAQDVSRGFTQARQNARSELERFGIDPSQTRARALDLSTRTSEAAARAGAANQARQATQAQGQAMRQEAINIGRGYPAQVQGSFGSSLQAGQGAVGAGNQTFSTGSQAMGTPTQWNALGLQGINQWGQTINTGYQNALDYTRVENQTASGLGSLLGMGLGMGLKAGGVFEEGGAVPEDEEMGRAVNVEMSPSRGAAIDDVPAMSDGGTPMRLNAGEFVLPDDVTRWLGEKHMQNMIVKAREEKANAGAQPRMAAIDTGGPAPRQRAVNIGG